MAYTESDPDTGTEQTDRTPLLGSSTRSVSPLSDTTVTTEDGHANDTSNNEASLLIKNEGQRALIRPAVIALVFVVMFLVELGVGMSIPPMNAIMEAIICRQMHPDAFDTSPTTGTTLQYCAGGLILSDDPVCKSPDVQGYLAMLKGWTSTFECIPGILMAVPYGILSDRRGRRPVLGFTVVGMVLSQVFTFAVFYFSNIVPLWWIWLSAVFQFIGGGGNVFVAILYTLLADVVQVDQRATVFLRFGAVFLASQMVAGPIGGGMMVRDPWFPLLVSLGVLFIGNVIVLFLPETLQLHDTKRIPAAQQRQDETVMDQDTSVPVKLWRKAKARGQEVWEFILLNKKVTVLMMSLVFVILGRFVGDLLLQYATKRYDWSWSRASMVLIIRNATSLVTLLALMPLASWLCVHHLHMSAVTKDIWLARWSGVMGILGCLVIAAAANGYLFSVGLVWFALGSGMPPIVRSLLNGMVEEHHVGTLNVLVGLLETVGLMMAGPLLSKSLSVGMNLGGAWVGLPFLVAGIFFVISTTVVWIFGLPSGQRRRQSFEQPS
ncbi:major facilitator superfamily domain-containing protein [Podospora australis]|uniref:Major facilitator superfamily domain-containing protein n=1 Tax=Podospora australis TaxID=1536484 RepID=A0AAN6WUC1_9PEZI|nr:major facilitator superfamily domain-containing protein [Podospora australis]